ncbi:RNA-binding protein [Spirochaetia bacterium]|nr:RNA-binding protein [Spirochaetia bacterium]
MPPQFDKEKNRKKISLMLEKIKTEVDPHLLNEYRSLFKKEVSFFRRSWMAAYLLMLSDQGQGNTSRFDRNRDRYAGQGGRNTGEKGDAGNGNSRSDYNRPDYSRAESRIDQFRIDQSGTDQPRTETPRRPLPEEESRRLFISIGRNRRVFPREILGLINAKTGVSRDDIGAIRILDNYSFVQVRDSVADEIIEALNGKPFRGRTLSVNYARARRDEEDREEDSPVAGDSAAEGNAGDAADDVPADDSGEYGEDQIGDRDESAGSLEQEDDSADEEGV